VVVENDFIGLMTTPMPYLTEPVPIPVLNCYTLTAPG
jgi:hypothetical protein